MFPARFIPFKRSTHETSSLLRGTEFPSISDSRMLIDRRHSFFFEFLQNFEDWKEFRLENTDSSIGAVVNARKDWTVCRPLYSRRGAIDIIEKAR